MNWLLHESHWIGIVVMLLMLVQVALGWPKRVRFDDPPTLEQMNQWNRYAFRCVFTVMIGAIVVITFLVPMLRGLP